MTSRFLSAGVEQAGDRDSAGVAQPAPGQGERVGVPAALAEDHRGSVSGAAGYPGSGTVPDQVRYCQLPAGHNGQHEADLPEGFFTWQHRPASEVRRPREGAAGRLRPSGSFPYR